jgi:hypothetical protein
MSFGVGVQFDKERVRYLLDCLDGGKPIEAPAGGGWTAWDMLMLAGACQFVVSSQGPLQYRDGAFEALPAEHREAVNESFLKDLGAAISWAGFCAMLVQDGEYDGTFEPVHLAIIKSQPDGKPEVQVLRGGRKAT